MNVFLSYNRQSAAVAKLLAADLDALDHEVWFDQELSGGQVWWDHILSVIRDCDLFILALDPAALNSTACKRELGYAAALNRPILPVQVGESISPNLLPPVLSKVQFVDYSRHDRKAAFRLARALSKVDHPTPLPDAMPTPPEAPISYLGQLSERVATGATLDINEQSALLVDLKRSLRDEETAEDGATLLATLRRRRDLFATIAEEIDLLLAAHQTEPAAEPEPEPEPVPRPTPRPALEPEPQAPADDVILERLAQTPDSAAAKPAAPAPSGRTATDANRARTSDSTPTVPQALALNLFFGIGLFFVDPRLKRRWLYLAAPVYAVADVILGPVMGIPPFDSEAFGGGSFIAALAVFGFSFLDVGFTCYRRRSGGSKGRSQQIA